MKPRIGQQIRFAHDESRILGEVIGHESRNICIVRTPEGDTDRFISKFRDGLNKRFTWDGKPNED